MKRIIAAANYDELMDEQPTKRVTFAKEPVLFIFSNESSEELPAARVIEAHSLNDLDDIVALLPAGTLIAFDLDNMTMEPQQLIGSDQWFEAMLHNLTIKHGGDMQQAFSELIPIYNNVHMHTDVKPVEPHTPHFINMLHSKHKVIGLTSRGKELADATHRQLNSILVNFNHASTHQNRDVDLSHLGSTSYATNGIVFAGGKNKGMCLKKFMDEMGYTRENTPHILFLDDKKHHVELVKKAALEIGINFTGIRYSHLDEKIKEVDLNLANLQLTHHTQHGKFLTDDAARHQLNNLTTLANVATNKPKLKLVS